MAKRTYATPPAGLLPQTALTMDRSVFKTAYAVIPARVQRDIVTTRLPHWKNTRFWVLARPLSGFAETFAEYVVEVSSGGGSDQPEPDPDAEGVLFVLQGNPKLTLDGKRHTLKPGSYVFIGPRSRWSLSHGGKEPAQFIWVRKRYSYVDGIEPPKSFVTHDDEHDVQLMPDCNGVWGTTRFIDTNDVAHDMHVTIVTLQPGGVIPFQETHVMEHGLYVLEGKAVYNLNEDWVEVEPGDFLWLRAFCPQACYTAGPGPFRYLLYKDMSRHPALTIHG
ncbi:MAG: (S)-ureidoglycine aminohydrolase [Burkholderiaceae bacterium]|jgi:(S)-ureidoglycine aminohydrolase|nr:MAG: (S)-ureidoglycine aminohydrolase [Burkholderiaceae bacterium]